MAVFSPYSAILVLTIFSSASVFAEDYLVAGNATYREGRFFSFWSKDQDSDVVCSSGGKFGTCQSSASCKTKGGTTLSNGNCQNRNVCCQVTVHCESAAANSDDVCVIKYSGTTITREENLSSYRITYRYKRPKGVCQLRLDFDEFEVARPVGNGDCSIESTQVRGVQLCGFNTGQHVYLDFGESSKIDVPIRIQDLNPRSKYSIRNTYIPCKSDRLAPPDCLQYYTRHEDTVRSFNFNPSGPNQQTNNQDYSVCVKAREGMNTIQWKTCTNVAGDPFFLSGGGLAITNLEASCCDKDWISIYGKDRYCGKGFPPVISTIKPFLLNVHFDQAEGFGVQLPTDPANCAGIYPDPVSGGQFECILNPNGGSCTCTYEPPGGNPPMKPPQGCPLTDQAIIAAAAVDADNTGFCLEYVQMT